MIVTLTCNPACDRTLIAPGFRHSDMVRVQTRHDSAGGKGLNVARAIHTLGHTVTAIAPLGGATGALVAQLALAEGIPLVAVPIAGETRTCLSLTDPAAPDQIVVNEPGPPLSRTEWHHLCAVVVAHCAEARILTISGSLPPGVTPDDLAHLIAGIPASCHVLLDTSGAPLRACLDTPLALIKVNAHEFCDVYGAPLTTPTAFIAAARTICQRGPQAIVITQGATGALAITADAAWHIDAPPIHAVSPVGSGDCTLAGIAVSYAHGLALAEAVCAGVACGSANALVPHAGVFDVATYQQFLTTRHITHIP